MGSACGCGSSQIKAGKIAPFSDETKLNQQELNNDKDNKILSEKENGRCTKDPNDYEESINDINMPEKIQQGMEDIQNSQSLLTKKIQSRITFSSKSEKNSFGENSIVLNLDLVEPLRRSFSRINKDITSKKSLNFSKKSQPNNDDDSNLGFIANINKNEKKDKNIFKNGFELVERYYY